MMGAPDNDSWPCKSLTLAMRVGPLSEAAFVARYPHPFLVENLSGLGLDDSGSFRTTPDSLGHGLSRANLFDAKVYPVRKQRGAFRGMINIGRTETNDIALPHNKVSKFHAYLSEGPKGWTITDSQSANGTYLGRERLEPIEPLTAIPLPSRCEIFFSRSCSLLFFENADCYTHLIHLLELRRP